MSNAVRILIVSIILSMVGIGIQLVTGTKFDPPAFAALIDWQPLGVALVVPTVLLWWGLAGWRTKIIAAQLGGRITLGQGVRALLLSLFAATVTPGASGSTFGQGWYLSRFIDPKQATAVTVYTLALDMVFYAWSLPVSFLVLGQRGVNLHIPVIGPILGVIILIVSVVALIVAWAMVYRSIALSKLVWAIFGVSFLRRWQRGAHGFVHRTGRVLSSLTTLPPAMQLGLHVLTFLAFLAHFLAFNVIAWALGIPGIDHINILASQTLLVAISFLVPTPGGSGYFEAGLAVVMRAGGVLEDAILGLTLIWRFLSYFLYVFIGPFIGGPALLRATESARKPETDTEA